MPFTRVLALYDPFVVDVQLKLISLTHKLCVYRLLSLSGPNCQKEKLTGRVMGENGWPCQNQNIKVKTNIRNTTQSAISSWKDGSSTG